MLVGRSHECDYPAWVRQLPECSEPTFDVTVPSGAIDAEVRRKIAAGEDLYRVHGDRIRELKPDLVIAQAHCEVCAVTPSDLERSGACLPSLSLSAASVEGIFESIAQVAARLGVPVIAQQVVNRERLHLSAVRAKTAKLRRPTIVMLEWTDPLFAMGNWGPELVEFAGGELLIGKPGEYSKSIPAEQLIAADPEFLIVAPCGFNLDRATREQTVLERNAWWHGLQAVRAAKVAFADGNRFFNRSGMAISQTAEIIAEILHGVTFGPPARGSHWRWIGDRA
jgi:iron complex transport system substrate-binding protein